MYRGDDVSRRPSASLAGATEILVDMHPSMLSSEQINTVRKVTVVRVLPITLRGESMREVSSDRENKSTLNLGLDEILGQADSSIRPADAPTVPPSAGGLVATAVESQAKLAPKGEYELLAESGNWDEIIRRSERSSTVEARLWWARAQCELAAMPLSIIAAPLEQSLSEISRGQPPQNIIDLATDVATKLSQALIERNEFNLATALLDSGRKITPRIDAKFRAAAGLELEQLNRLPARDLDKQRLARKTYLSGFVAEMQKHYAAPKLSSETSAPFARSNRRVFSFGQRLALAVIAATILTLISLYYLGAFAQTSISSEGGTLAVTTSRPDVDPPNLKSAALQRASATSLLEAVLIEDQQRHSDSRIEPGSSADSLVINDRPAATAHVETQPVAPQLPLERKPKERINTSTPLEPREIRDAGTRSNDRNRRPDRADELFEKPQDQRTNGSTSSADTQRYRVLVRTEVHAVPSFSSNVLQRLERGDPVAVEEREGQWFKIRGRNGKFGYIAAQDVEPE